MRKTLLRLPFAFVVVLGLIVGAAPPSPKPAAEDSPEYEGGKVSRLPIKVETYGEGDTKDTRYFVPLENGKIRISEYPPGKVIAAGDGTAGFLTGLNASGARASHLFLTGTKYQTEYIDLDGDGILDAMENRTMDKLFIWVDGKWLEVGRQKVGFSEGNRRRTVGDEPANYVFKGSRWVKE